MSGQACSCSFFRRTMLVVGVMFSIWIAVTGFYLVFNLEDLVVVRKIFGDLSELGQHRLHDYIHLAQWTAGVVMLGGFFAAHRCCQKWCNPRDNDPIFR